MLNIIIIYKETPIEAQVPVYEYMYFLMFVSCT